MKKIDTAYASLSRKSPKVYCDRMIEPENGSSSGQICGFIWVGLTTLRFVIDCLPVVYAYRVCLAGSLKRGLNAL